MSTMRVSVGSGMESDYAMERLPPKVATPKNDSSSRDGSEHKSQVDGEEALLDLAQLEELHQEAERMKALGNKHMAAQEYTRAYNAYSAALQLSPVGPSSHVFLSNRAAALLSLKRYSAAATDARRAVALAPTFGKAHARLGQALYFLKDYAGAVAAYEDAIQYEPDNQVTQTYLEKAKAKLAKQQDKAQRFARGEDVSIADTHASAQSTVINSIASDPNASAAIVSGEFRGSQQAMTNAIRNGEQKLRYGKPMLSMNNEDDPDFDEALSIQKRANRFLANKQYKNAIEEYTAALFLVPDDPNLSPQLHLGRAHALNGSRRHASARNDAQLAIKIQPSAEAYSTLAKSLFYLKEYEAAIEAFENTKKLLPDGERLSGFDQAYLEKAKAAVGEVFRDPSPRKSPSKSPVPKLPPPRFVPREEAINSTPNLPPMPKQWPQQSPRSPSALRCGTEREIIFFSESLGIKLNRGPDGIVRVLSVSKETPGSPVARKGEIDVGDVVREAAGVDIRRPITNIMWGDTVALIRLSPRPISLIVAKELSEVPQSVLEQRRLAEEEERNAHSAAQAKLGEMKLNDSSYRPSPSSGDGKVAVSPGSESKLSEPQSEGVEVRASDNIEDIDSGAIIDRNETEVSIAGDAGVLESNEGLDEVEADRADSAVEETTDNVVGQREQDAAHDEKVAVDEFTDAEQLEPATTPEGQGMGGKPESNVSLRDEEESLIGAEILFPRNSSQLALGGWDNLRWMSYSGARKVRHCHEVERLIVAEKKGFNLFGLGAPSCEAYLPRKLVIYEEPKLILLLRAPNGAEELRVLLDLPEGTDLNKDGRSMDSFLVVEAAAEPISCKLRLSPLTTPTSVTEDDDDNLDDKRRSCFHILTPMETLAMTAIVGEKADVSYTDSGAFLETTTAELAISKAIFHSHHHSEGELARTESNLSWKHQLILGTLHSDIVLGSQKLLKKAIVTAMKRSKENVVSFEGKPYLDSRLVDKVDDCGLTALHYACLRRFSIAVADLVSAGARIDIRTQNLEMTPMHICAENLDHKSLSIILSAIFPVKANPNLMDALGRTPMYIAAIDGRGPLGERDAAALGRCLMALGAWGGQMLSDPTTSQLRWPHGVLAAGWQPEELAEVIRHSNTRYPLPDNLLNKQRGASIGAFYQYPLHWALISLVKETQSLYNHEEGSVLYGAYEFSPDKKVSRTILTLIEHGFEPNERLDQLDGFCKFAQEYEEFVGFAPLQILACAALDAENLNERVAESELNYIFEVIADVANVLVENGARLALDAPPLRRSIKMSDSSASSHQDDGPVIDAYDRSSLKLDSNKKLLSLLGGNERLNVSKQIWLETKKVPAPPTFILPFEHESILDDKLVPGGTNEKSCSICWREFGLMKRRHKCRISLRYVCDECSTKRVVYDGVEHRISDGQFLLLCADKKKGDEHTKETKRQQQEAEIEQMTRTREEARKKRLDAEAQRESLFGGVMGKAASFLAGEDDSVSSKPATAAAVTGEEIGGLSETLGNTRNALLDRGDKLNSLSDKSAEMVDASANFAKMAKELQKQSERGFFW